MTKEEIVHLETKTLQPNPLQARRLITPESLEELVSSVKEHGILEPLIVAETPAGYQIIAGERRWRAAKIAGLKEVPVILKETTTRGMLELALVENVQREDLNPIERAQAFKRLVDDFGLPIVEIAHRIGKSSSYISNSIRLLSLPDAVKDGLVSGAIAEGHARAISGLGKTELIVSAYKQILTQNKNVRDAEELARRIKSKKKIGRSKTTERVDREKLDKMTEHLEEATGAKVEIRQTKIQTRLSFTFQEDYSQASRKLEKIYKKLIA